METTSTLLVADECWVALALLHREQPQRISFTPREILDKISSNASGAIRAGVQPHVYLHNVANLPPNSARYRMFYRLEDGSLRLWRPGDPHHPARKGKTKPKAAELPEELHELLQWYENEYCRLERQTSTWEDPIIQMLGVGQQLWAEESGDAFVARERRDWESAPLAVEPAVDLRQVVWERLKRHEGEEFGTTTDLPFRYEIDGNGLRPIRENRKIHRRLPRTDIEKAVSRCPLEKVKDVSDCQGPSYLFGLLSDPRIRQKDW